MDAKLGNYFLAIASVATLFSPSLFFVRLDLLAAPSEVNVRPPESVAKGSVTESSEVSVSCLNPDLINLTRCWFLTLLIFYTSRPKLEVLSHL